ncbi:MAG: hypothetical protein E6H05_08955 [Bacillati bacterium ANGP1]|uniref:IstB-like ATP-binding domain-containing protein n=1 Tax=Candidatus Segetimicrobium genomatis TaxID=2569760 RepID=A0A537IRA3_9BACT|nr:MAG: hypothetical protein E6H05_08955 [Terrabacteria group bacterium ANGP1]
MFFQFVSAPYERGSIILTNNKSYGDWGTIFGDPIIATAILDRLLHHSTTLNIRGESYQLKERKKARAAARGSRAAQARQSRSGLPGGENRLLGDPRRGVFSPGRYLATEASELYVVGNFQPAT